MAPLSSKGDAPTLPEDDATRFLDAVIDQLPAMVFLKTASDLRFVRFNRAGEDLLGLSRAALIGRNDHDLFPKEQADFFVQKDREVLHGKVTLEIPEEPIETPRGTRWLHTRKIPLLDERGQVTHLLGISLDITDARTAVEDVRRAKEALEASNRELEGFAYSVSHDLRAPLRAIDGFSQALLEDELDRLSPRGKDYLRRVRAATERMTSLIDDLLELSRVGRAELRRAEVDLGAVSRALLEELRSAEPEREVSVTIEGDLTLEGDATLLGVAMRNLLGNAWKYTSRKPRARIEVRGERANDETVITVRDDGAGFDPKYAGRLFSPFYRLHTAAEFPGDGIGLATVRRIAHRHGGRVRGVGVPGEGATFTLVLPTRAERT